MFPSGATPLSGRYLVRNPVLRAALTARDGLTAIFRQADGPPIPSDPSRILLAAGGQLGDAVIATSAIKQLRSVFPLAEISMLCPPAAAPVLVGHRDLARIHTSDHWFWGRRTAVAGGAMSKWSVSRHGRRNSIEEIAAARYDMAIDLYPFYPNFSDVLFAAGIPIRVGYASAGGGPLLTHALEWPETRAHVSQQHSWLLSTCWPDRELPPPAYDLPSPLAPDAAAGDALMATHELRDGGFVLLHPGTSNPLKRWPTGRWVELARRITGGVGSIPQRVILTGSGDADRAVVDEIVSRVEGSTSLCNATSLGVLRHVLARAHSVVAADSVAAHLAAAEGRPTIAIMAGMSDVEHWRPLGDHVTPLMSDAACSPCFRSRGCETMSCVRDVSVQQVLAALLSPAG